MEWTHSRFTSALIPACFAGFEAASQSTKRAELGGDSESFTLKRRRRASLSKSADEGTQAGEEPRFGSMGIFANKWRSVVNQKAQRISKSELSGCRGRDTDHSVPPAQNRTSASTHTASALDIWRQSVPLGKDARPEGAESIGRRAV